MADKETTPILLVYLGVRFNGKGLDHYWMPVTQEELDSGTANKNTRSYDGKESKKYMTASPGTIFEVPEVTGSENSSIYPAKAQYKGLWPVQSQRTEWQLEHRTATTTADLKKRSKQETTEDNFAVLLPFREKYRKLVSQNQRAALLAQMIAFVTG